MKMVTVMKNNAYWKRRMEMLETAQLEKGQRFYADLERQYRIASANIEKEINNWYQRFAENNQITMAEAKKLLKTGELAEFKWNVQEYIKYGEENALNQQWMKELENASARVHISRLEALKLQLQQQVEILYGNQVDGLDKLLRDIYSDGYYHTAFEIQRGFNIGWDLHDLDSNQLDKILSRPWSLDGRTFSDRIWVNKQQLIGSLQTQLTQAVIRGESPDVLIKNLAQQMNVDRNKAGRLIMTESAAFASAAQKDCFNDLGVEKYEIVATLDNRTSRICQELDGEVFDMKDYQVGVTAPPFHPWCRTTTVPYFEDNYGERAARDAEGKVYYVPSNIKYKDWKKAFVDGGSKDGLKELDISGKIIKEFIPAKTIIEAQEYAKAKHNINADYSKYNLDVANAINKELDRFKDIFGDINTLKNIGTFPKGFSTTWAGAYSSSQQSLWLRNVSKKDALEKLKAVAEQQFKIGHWSTSSELHTIRHEIGHAIHEKIKLDKTVENITKLDMINNLRTEIMQEVLKSRKGTAAYKEYLSKYGMTNTGEFIAESIAEYMNGNPREVAKKVVEILINPVEGLISND